jgi:RNA polymerase sigma-70 factor (ECF subfamily)
LADTDELLMRKVAKGDLAAFRLLMERWEGAAKRYAYRSFGDYQAAEDAAQETFVRLFRSAGRYEPTAKFSTYFYTVLGNLCRDRARAAKRRAGHGETVEDVFVLDETVEGRENLAPEPRVETEEERTIVRAAVSELPEKLREALSLREFEGLSYVEIAGVMGANLGEVKTWIHRGRKRLAHSLRNLATPEERREQRL